jgi:hypothetical protein
MKAGRELDALIAEKVMGWEYRDNFYSWGELVTPAHWIKDNGWTTDKTPNYSESIADAWLVVEKLRGLGTVDLMDDDGKRWISLIIPKFKAHVRAQAETAPLAICKAALKACGVEEEG